MTNNKRNILATAAVTIAVLFSASHASFSKITKGPYVQNLKTDGITICWESDKILDTVVKVVPENAATGSAPITISAKSNLFGEINVSGLAPSTKYKYQVIQTGGDADGGVFTTAPVTTIPFRFAAYGDTRSNPDMHKKIMTAIKKYNPALVLNSGDLVGDGRKQSDWDTFFKTTNTFMKDIPLYPSPGNHEQDSSLYFQYFSLPRNGDNERYYSFTYSNVLFVVIDSNAPYYMLADQKNFVKKVLSESRDSDFRVVMFHHPLYSSSRREPNLSHRQIYIPIFKKYKVDLVLNGHDHFYERSEDGSGIEYVITGGGGAPLYGFERNNPESKVKKMVHHFMIIDVSGPGLRATAIDADGNVIDEFTIKSKTAN